MAHEHLNELMWSWHVPPFKHGALEHSSISISHWVPVKPEEIRFKLVIILNQSAIYKPGMQTHRNVPGSSRQLPSFWQGWDSHSFMLVSHRGPVNPWLQLQANEPGMLTQIPLCSHGDPARWCVEYKFLYWKTKIKYLENIHQYLLSS